MKARHIIAEARLRDEEAWVACSCGAVVTADDPEATNEAYQRHRVEVGERRGESSRGVRVTPWRDTVGAPPSRLTDAARRYRERHPERVRESARAYRARKRAERAA